MDMEDDISSIAEQNTRSPRRNRRNRISHKTSIRKFLRNVWRKIEAEIDGKEYKNTDDNGDHYFFTILLYFKNSSLSVSGKKEIFCVEDEKTNMQYNIHLILLYLPCKMYRCLTYIILIYNI
ncbi:uncharacterized protein LOC117151660 [Bombus impatiens]|uniref:Uncharacterized protein LOC117151660 n=1 Tax=Bombus impatiens TaxID=132113 RepID=A0A6P8L4Y3_BOMIM|nr:uncharacterized protein LOC117151660 [Bombus impatiens]